MACGNISRGWNSLWTMSKCKSHLGLNPKSLFQKSVQVKPRGKQVQISHRRSQAWSDSQPFGNYRLLAPPPSKFNHTSWWNPKLLVCAKNPRCCPHDISGVTRIQIFYSCKIFSFKFPRSSSFAWQAPVSWWRIASSFGRNRVLCSEIVRLRVSIDPIWRPLFANSYSLVRRKLALRKSLQAWLTPLGLFCGGGEGSIKVGEMQEVL